MIVIMIAMTPSLNASNRPLLIYSPTERAAYILREAFDYSYRQIADILQMKEANTRQLVSLRLFPSARKIASPESVRV
jgi:DNA-directed RNA polymerase specialized sigma24 family protein